MQSRSPSPSRRGRTFRRRHAAGRLAFVVYPAALLATVFLGGCKKPEAVAPPPPVVEVMEITTSEVPLTATLIGQLDSPQNVEVRARVEAFVDKMPFIEGHGGAKGGRCCSSSTRNRSMEKLAAAEGRAGGGQGRARTNIKPDVDRLTPLAEKKAIPQQDLDNALASVDMGKAGVLTAQARVESAQLDLGYCEMQAPHHRPDRCQAGVHRRSGRQGRTHLVSHHLHARSDLVLLQCQRSGLPAGAGRRASRPAKKIEDLPLTLILANGAEHPEPGKFVFIDRAVDTKTGTIRGTRREFPEQDKLLRPGMFARVRVNLGKQPDCITVPERAIVELQGKTFVWLVGSRWQGQPARGDHRRTGRPACSSSTRDSRRVRKSSSRESTNSAKGIPVTIATAAPAANGRRRPTNPPRNNNNHHGRLLHPPADRGDGHRHPHGHRGRHFTLPAADFGIPERQPHHDPGHHHLPWRRRRGGHGIRGHSRSRPRSTAWTNCSTCSRSTPTTAR